MGPIIFELWVMETENWITETGHPNSLLVINDSVRLLMLESIAFCFVKYFPNKKKIGQIKNIVYR